MAAPPIIDAAPRSIAEFAEAPPLEEDSFAQILTPDGPFLAAVTGLLCGANCPNYCEQGCLMAEAAEPAERVPVRA